MNIFANTIKSTKIGFCLVLPDSASHCSIDSFALARRCQPVDDAD